MSPIPIPVISITSLRGGTFVWTRRWHRGTLDQFVELAAIQPHATALWAVINLNALALTHDQGNFWARRAFHYILLMRYSLKS